jgi:hypothetical protein
MGNSQQLQGDDSHTAKTRSDLILLVGYVVNRSTLDPQPPLLGGSSIAKNQCSFTNNTLEIQLLRPA